MNKSILIGVVAIVIVGGALFVFSSPSGKDAAMQKEEVMQKNDTAMEKKDGKVMEKTDATVMQKKEGVVMEKKDDVMTQKDEGVMMDKDDAMMKAGSYEAYSAGKIAKAATGDVVLFFHASWCPTCRAVDSDINARRKDIPASLTILDVNYDDSSALKAKYGVTYQHTFVQVDAQGNQIKKWQGSPTLAALVAEVQ